ncbi:MAG: hypothetical protein IKW86_11165 [Salinivirgaceae bacterium]|nr:hypothetical protein [Salinivirgaceae bacterium]
MGMLKEKLEDFEWQINDATDEKKLQELFEKLAPVFIYGGYINVNDVFQVFIKTVEFYFHSEKTNGIHDPIVYHRNGRDLEKVPFFPLMTLNAHNSGFDITFESQTGEYRASALIRSYEVKDKEGMYLIWNKEKCMFERKKEYGYNKQSTYLYALLNGFSLGKSNNIYWKDDFIEHSNNPKGKPRQNVFKSANEFEYKKLVGEKCTREWSFTREEQI